MRKNKLIIIILFLIYVITRLINLTLLPVFADEAIYIRWATMIFRDPQQYLFLPLFDGKTPLFIWTLIPIVRTFTQNPLWGGRLLVVVFGLMTAWVLTRIVRNLHGSFRAEIMTFLLYTILPLTFFFDRMSLIDVPLTFFLSLTFLFGLKWNGSGTWKHALLTGCFWGLAFLTKSSALYVLPILIILGIYKSVSNHHKHMWYFLLQFAASGAVGLLFVVCLKISPLFPFLFNRSSDFAFSISEIITNPVMIISENVSRVTPWVWWYLSPVLWIMTGISLLFFVWKRILPRAVLGLFLCGFLFIAPFIVSGKLLTSRYFLPSVIWFIPAFGLLLDYWYTKSRVVGIVVSTALLVYGAWFIVPLYTNLNATQLLADDKQQYLSEWSAGFGIPEIRQFIIDQVESGKTVLIGTEGYFGTLPDGLYIYFSETNWLSQIMIIGVGQPLINTPKELIEKSPLYDETYLVVNQNRITYDYSDTFEVVNSYAKPYNGSPLLLLRLKR